MVIQSFQGELSNPTCHNCRENVATHYCKCSDSRIFLCLTCVPNHHTKPFRTPHQVVPIAKPSQQSEKHKSKVLTNSIAELRKNVERAEQCYDEFAGFMQKCIDYLTEYRSFLLRQLQADKEELRVAVEAAIEEARNCLTENVKPTSPLAQAVWTLLPEELAVFSYAVNAPDLHALCQSWAQYHNNLRSLCERFPPRPVQEKEVTRNLFVAVHGNEAELYDTDTHNLTKHVLARKFEDGASLVEQFSPRPAQEKEVTMDLFAAVHGNAVELYDTSTRQLTKHVLAGRFGDGASFVALDRSTLLCLGDYPPSTAVFELNLLSFQLISLCPLRVPRGKAGAVLLSDSVYAFGGVVEWKSCEKYVLQSRQWQVLGNMKYDRYGFTPCVFRTLIYLPCPWTTPVIETFTPKQRHLVNCLSFFQSNCRAGQ